MSERDELILEIERAKKRMEWKMAFTEPGRMIREKPATISIYSVPFSAVLFITGFLNLQPDFLDDLGIICALIAIAPVGIAYHLYERRRRRMEKGFIEFMRDLVDVTSAGMTLAESLVAISRREYGALTEEVRRMARMISWGLPFNDVMQRFAERTNSMLIKRTVSLIIQANISGGEFQEAIKMASKDATEMKILEEERRGNMLMYTIIVYIAFFVFLFVIFVLAKMFLPEFAEASASEIPSMGYSVASLSSEEITRISFHSSIIQGFISGLIAGKMGEGSAYLGIKHSVILVLVSYLLFTFFL